MTEAPTWPAAAGGVAELEIQAVAAGGAALRAFDLFPQTAHVEVVATFTLRAA